MSQINNENQLESLKKKVEDLLKSNVKENNEKLKNINEEKNKNEKSIKKGTELFIGNLSYEINEGDLYAVFSPFGKILDVYKIYNIYS